MKLGVKKATEIVQRNPVQGETDERGYFHHTSGVLDGFYYYFKEADLSKLPQSASEITKEEYAINQLTNQQYKGKR